MLYNKRGRIRDMIQIVHDILSVCTNPEGKTRWEIQREANTHNKLNKKLINNLTYNGFLNRDQKLYYTSKKGHYYMIEIRKIYQEIEDYQIEN